MRKEIEDRLIALSIQVINQLRKINKDYATEYLSNQLIRSVCSAALNYGETQSAESNKDFIHKLSIVLKELRETYMNLQILSGVSLSQSLRMDEAKDECNQLISIFYKSLKTAKSKQTKK